MRMNAGIILQGQTPNMLQSIDMGNQVAARQLEGERARRLDTLFQEQGAGIMAGDQGALQAYAGIDPQAALGIQREHQQMRMSEERLRLARAAGAREASRFAQAQDDRAAQAELAELDQVLARMTAAQSPEQWDALAASNPELSGLAGQFENREMALGELFAMRQGFEEAYASQFGQQAQPDYQEFNGQIIDMNNPQGGVVSVPGMDATSSSGSAAEQAISRMVGIGIPYDIAVRIEDGVFRTVTDPVTRETVVIDVASGQPVHVVGAEIQQPAQAPQENAQPLQFSQTEPGTPGNAQSAFGLPGVAGGFANGVTDFFTGQLAFPEIAENQRFFRTYEEDALVFLAQAYERQPAQALMDRIRQLVPNVGTAEGAGRAEGELRALRDRFASDLASVEASMDRRISPQDREVAMQQSQALRQMLARTDEALARFGGGSAGVGGTTSTGLQWRIVE